MVKWVDGNEVMNITGSLETRLAENRLFDQCYNSMESTRQYMPN